MSKIKAATKAVNQVARREKLPPEDRLLTRDEFDRYVKLRSMGYCVCCERPAVDSHHILDRKLFSDGGYYLGNGAALCDKHHRLAEITAITVEEVRRKAHIINPVLPTGFDKDKVYDKWGNIIVSDDIILLGPLKLDGGCRKALIIGKKAGKLYEAMPYMIEEVKK